MPERPPTFEEIRARLASLRAERETDPAPGSPSRTPTAEQFSAMRDTMGILSDPEILARVRKARRAVAAAELVDLEDVFDARPTAPGQWRVVLAAPVARELTECARAGDPAPREALWTLTGEPTQGRALGFGLVGMRSLTHGTCRVLYAIDDERRVVTVLSVDRP